MGRTASGTRFFARAIMFSLVAVLLTALGLSALGSQAFAAQQLQGQGLQLRTQASAHSADDAIAWVQSQVGRTIEADGSAPGTDEYAQCVDLIKAYYSFLGVSPVWGCGKDYAINPRPPGWSRIQWGKPQKGDVLIYSGNSFNPSGHVAIYESDYVTYHQNVSGQYVERITGTAYNGFKNDYWGYLRPRFGYAPQGYLDSAVGGDGTVRVKGWALDRDVPGTQLNVHVYVGGPAGTGECHVITANKARPDVNRVMGVSGNHGFDATFKTKKRGSVKVYAYGISPQGGDNPQLTNVKTASIARWANPITVKAKSKTLDVSYEKLKKKSQSISKAKAFVINNAKGSVTFKKRSGNARISVSKAGVITLGKGMKKGTYKMQVYVTASGQSQYYMAATKTVTLSIRVL